jgi:hypothetical protein
MVAVAMLATAPSPEHRPVALAAEQPAPEIDPALGIFNLDHVIFVVQENGRSSFFGTFPEPTASHSTSASPSKACGACHITTPSSTREARTTSAPRESRRRRADGRSDPFAPSDRNACKVNHDRCHQAVPGAERGTRRDGACG